MKACILVHPASVDTQPLQFTEVQPPEPGVDEVLVRVHCCAVCRTDLHVVEDELPTRKSPIIPGHEVIGVIERAGAKAGRFPIGTRIGIAWLHRTDGTCRYCLRGLKISVTARNLLGTPKWGLRGIHRGAGQIHLPHP